MTADASGRPRTGLGLRIALLGVTVAVLTAVLAGALSVGLVRQAGRAGARQQLARIADEAAAQAARTPLRTRGELRALRISAAVISDSGAALGTDPARTALTPAQVAAVLAGRRESISTRVDGHTVLVEARPLPSGGLVLAQRLADGDATGEAAVRRLLLGLLVGAVLGALLGLVVAARLARPLRRTAAAAHALAVGRRDVAVPAEGPTEVAEVADALNVLTAHLTHSEARQREFLLSVSHDLRTPLTAVAGYAEALADGLVPPAEAAGVGATMLAETRRLDRLVADLLDLARLDAEDLRLDVVPTDLAGVLEGAATVWAARCAAAGVEFRRDWPAGSLVVATDPVRLRQLLDGLFDNALRVVPAGASIVLGARATADRVEVQVRDGGPGLAEDDLAVAFDRGALYERYRGIRPVGTGLGLAIVARLADRLGGEVRAGHAPEGGACFTVGIPLAPGPDSLTKP